MKELLLKDKIFVTGIFGSGKTYFCKNFIAKNPKYNYLDFDSNYNYQTKNLDKVHRLMESHEHFLIDALPLNGSSESLKYFQNYCLNNDCTIILMKCDIDVWLNRLNSKEWYNKEAINEYKNNYNEFYSTWKEKSPKIGEYLLESFISGKIYIYDNSVNIDREQ